MKPWGPMIAGAMLVVASAQADSCDQHDAIDAAKDNAACKINAAKQRANQLVDRADGEMIHMKKKAAELQKKQKKMMKEHQDQASEQAQQTRKKWWKFWGK